MLRLLVRLIHIAAALTQFTIITLECFFDFKSFSLVQKDPFFKRVRAVSGLAMIFSGIMLTGLMYKVKGVHQQLANRWRGLHLNKFIISLMLTPFFEKLVFLLTGGLDDNHDVKGWPTILSQFKFGLIVGLYGFSAWTRKFREDNNDFVDEKQVRRVLDGVLRKIR